ncbi:sugar ABC transporter substrate-binding protein [Leucobacter chironomi]|uniref:sugar ABC transporter substrate-binding protein n=1 Tax=Leucobacter chironomi TaxID=491918 RepID=UPI0004038DBE|nr:sugar ABC transporter substrate-binding protein [Leucobacter chironomi]
MKIQKRKVLAIGALAVSAGLMLSSCGSPGTTGGEGGGGGDGTARIGAFLLASANAYAQQNMQGVKDAIEADGNAEVTFFDGEFSGATQLAQIQDAIASGQYDGFVVFVNDGVAIIPGVEEADEAGIPTVAAYAPIGEDISTGEPQVAGVVGTVWHPNEPSGEALGELAISACAEEHPDASPCKVAYISGGNTVLFEQAKLRAFEEIVGKADRPIEIVAQQEGNFLIEDSRTAAENILQANPDVNVIAATADQMTYGAQQAVEDAGLDNVSLVGIGASEEGVAAVDAGEWFGTTVFLPVDEGRLSTEMVLTAVRGGSVSQKNIELLDLSPIGAFYTRDTGGDFTPQWSSVG